MGERVILDIVARDWLDIRCLTRLLLTGDKSLKTLLVQNVRTLSQYYYADPRVYIWVWPRLAFRTFVNATEVILVTSFMPMPDSEHHDDSEMIRRSLDGCKIGELPLNLVRLRLKCTGLDSVDIMSEISRHTKLTDIDIHYVSDAGKAGLFRRFTRSGNIINYNSGQLGRIPIASTINRMDPSTLENLDIYWGVYGVSLDRAFWSSTSSLTRLRLMAISEVVDIAILPSTLRSLQMFESNLKNASTMHHLPLVDLCIDRCTWAETTAPVVWCPPSLLTLVTRDNTIRSLDERTIFMIPAELNSLSITPFSERVKVVDGGAMKGLTSLSTSTFTVKNRITLTFTTIDDIVVNDTIAILRTANNIRELNIYRNTPDRALLRNVNLLCPHLTALKYIHPFVDRRDPDDQVYCPPPNLVTCLISNLVFFEQVNGISLCIGLRELLITVKLEHLQKFNHCLSSLLSLETLRLGLYLPSDLSPEQEHRVNVLAPPSLLSLTMEPIEVNDEIIHQLYFSFIGTEEHPSGVPPRLKVLELLSSYTGSEFVFSSSQIDQLPASLEYFNSEHELTDEHRRRLHNLIVY